MTHHRPLPVVWYVAAIARSLLHFHRNVPGVVSAVNRVVGELGVNVVSQYLKTNEGFGYMILDVERKE